MKPFAHRRTGFGKRHNCHQNQYKRCDGLSGLWDAIREDFVEKPCSVTVIKMWNFTNVGGRHSTGHAQYNNFPSEATYEHKYDQERCSDIFQERVTGAIVDNKERIPWAIKNVVFFRNGFHNGSIFRQRRTGTAFDNLVFGNLYCSPP